MLRKLVVLFTSVVLFAAAHAKALGLGEIVLESSLNQPFNAQIALLQLGGVRPEQIQVQLANESDFARFSIDRAAFLDGIRFDVQSRGAETVVNLSTQDAVREPSLSFVLETRWPNGRLLNEYTVQLERPAVAANAGATAVQPSVSSTGAAQEVSSNQSSGQNSSRNSAAAPTRLAAAVQPEDSAAAALSTADSAETVTIGATDTLWDVALQVRPDSSVSVQQTMLALQSLNREAFIADNINMVRRGQVLRIPTLEQIRALSSREAMSEVARQNQLFDNRRNVPLTAQPLTAQPQAVSTGAGRGELTVVSVDNTDPTNAQSSASGQSAELDARIASLEDALAVQREEADRAALLNVELTERLGLLEQQIASAQEIIRLRDLELAQLQQSLADAAATAAAQEPQDPPTVITMAPEKNRVQQILDTLVANTYALLALLGLVIVMLVLTLLRRNRSVESAAALAGMESGALDAAPLHSAVASRTEPSLDAAVAADELNEMMSSVDSDDEALFAEPAHEASADSDELEQGARLEDAFAEAELAVAEDAAAVPLESSVEQAEQAAQAVLEEAEALIAYDKLAEAEAMLRAAIVAAPQRVDLRMGLLEVLLAKQDAAGFQKEETEIEHLGVSGIQSRIAKLRAQLDDDTASEILEAGEEDFFAELRSFGGVEQSPQPSADAEDDETLGAVAEASSDGDPVAADAENEKLIDFDFALLDDEASPQSGSVQKVAAVDDEIDYEFDLDADAEIGDTPSLVEHELDSDDDALIEFLDDADELASGTDTFDDLQFVDDQLVDVKVATLEDADSEDDDNLDFLSDMDEAATKLDLARAYFEMGDAAGAREILEEVVKEGSAEQAKDAKELLAKL